MHFLAGEGRSKLCFGYTQVDCVVVHTHYSVSTALAMLSWPSLISDLRPQRARVHPSVLRGVRGLPAQRNRFHFQRAKKLKIDRKETDGKNVHGHYRTLILRDHPQ